MSFFGAKIPVLDRASWRDLRATGDGWALIGDAAGFVDPITGEGIYYALRSADLLADALGLASGSPMQRRSDLQGARHGGYAQAQSVYEDSWRQAFGWELERASQMLPRFYRGYFLGHRFTDATIRFARYHEGVRKVLMRLIVGDQSYLSLKRDLMRSAWRVI